MCHVEDGPLRYLKRYMRKGDKPAGIDPITGKKTKAEPTGAFGFQYPIPRGLQDAYGLTIKEHGLGTRDLGEAMRKRDQWERFYLDQFAAITGLEPAEQQRIIARGGVPQFVKTTQQTDTLLRVAASLGAPEPTDDEHQKTRAYALRGQIAEAREELEPDQALVVNLQTAQAGNPLAPLRVLEAFLSTRALTGKKGITEETRIMKRRRVGAFAEFANHLPFDHPDFTLTCERFRTHRINSGASTGTANLDMADLQQLGAWVSQTKRIPNPCIGLRLPEEDAKNHTYKPQETRDMLAMPIAPGWDADHKAGLAFLVLSGCRLGDMIRLRPCDYRKLTAEEVEEGHGPAGMMVLDINEEEGHVKKQGRKHTIRLAPVHPELAPILVERQQQNTGKARMFDTVSLKEDGTRLTDKAAVKAFGKRHMRLLQRAGVAAGPGRQLDCHAWRHTSWSVAKRAGWTREAWLDLVGKAPEEKDYQGEHLSAGKLQTMLDTLDLGATGRGWATMFGIEAATAA